MEEIFEDGEYGLVEVFYKASDLYWDIKDVGDNLLNKMESHYPEGSWQDEAAETVAGSVRNIADIPDSDPNN